MRSLSEAYQHWPVPFGVLLSGALIVTTVAEKVTLPDWLPSPFAQVPDAPAPEQPAPEVPQPDNRGGVAYAPAPKRDDRTPLAFVSHVFGLNDPDLPAKFTGVGPVYWDHAGRGTGALIAPRLALTTAHLFEERGKWMGPFGPTDKAPPPSDGRIYLEACGRAYNLSSIHMGSMAPRDRLGLDYAIVELVEPACAEAAILPVALTPDDLTQFEDQVFLNLGAWKYSDIARYATHPVFAAKAESTRHHEKQAVFGVRCKPTQRSDTGDVADGSTAVIITDGCDGVPGGSGGPVVLSRDGGATYHIVGVANSYRPDSEYNNYTRIEGAFAKHLGGFVELFAYPASASLETSQSEDGPAGQPWRPMRGHLQEGGQ